LDDIAAEAPTNAEALVALKELTNQIKNWIGSHPGIYIDNIVFP